MISGLALVIVVTLSAACAGVSLFAALAARSAAWAADRAMTRAREAARHADVSLEKARDAANLTARVALVAKGAAAGAERWADDARSSAGTARGAQ